MPPNKPPTTCAGTSPTSTTARTASAWSYEARGDHRQAADYYRRAITVIRDHPDNHDPDFEAVFQKLVDRLEAQANATNS
jgi:hypothetical protein